MCFTHLPIAIDPDGGLTLDPRGWEAERPRPASVPRPRPEPASLREYRVAPVTRIAGAMDFYSQIDLANRVVHDARASAAAFRGYEMVLRNRDPREAMDISSRVCGVCGGVHSTTSSMALDMAFPVVPPPLGIIARNIAQAAELLYDHILHICLLAGPDYSEAIVKRSERTLYQRAEQWRAPQASAHGFATIADIMKGFNPLTGILYREAFTHTRAGLQMVAAMVGNYPHPTTMVPGGINVLLGTETFETIRTLSASMLDYVKKLVLVQEDVTTFYEEARPEYQRVGERPAHLLCLGRYDEVEAYDGTYEHMDSWAGRRSIPPGVVIDGAIRTTSLQAVNLGIEEFVDHAFYEAWSGHAVATDPLGGPVSPYHPWNKETKPRPDGRNWKERYTWSTAPRWDRQVVEAGPIARNWLLAAAGNPERWGGLLHNTGTAIDYTLPKSENLAELSMQWRVPERLNTLERNRARAHHLAITWLQIHLDCERGLSLLRRGERRVWTRSTTPDEGIGAGFWEAARGSLAHWVTIKDRRVENYQIITPSSFNASPRDPWGQPGPYEEAAINTPILEEFSSAEDFTGIDLMRTVRSFDPCMPCAVHMDTGAGVLVRTVISCGCGDDVS